MHLINYVAPDIMCHAWTDVISSLFTYIPWLSVYEPNSVFIYVWDFTPMRWVWLNIAPAVSVDEKVLNNLSLSFPNKSKMGNELIN